MNEPKEKQPNGDKNEATNVLKERFHDEIRDIASKHKVDVTIIKEVYDELLSYLQIHDPLQEFTKRLILKYDDFLWKIDQIDLAKISILFHEKKDELNLNKPNLFKEVVFRPFDSKIDPLKLSEFLANDMIKTYMEKLISNHSIPDKNSAECYLKYSKRKGKRRDDYIRKRNEMINRAAGVLKKNDVGKDYAFIVKSILHHHGCKEVTPSLIRVVVSRSK